MTTQRTGRDGRPITVHDNDGLYKRCGARHGCSRRQWTKCAHPWHAGFSWHGQEYRTSLLEYACEHLADYADKPADYNMGKLEAAGVRDQWRAAVRAGTWPKKTTPEAGPGLTFGDVCDEYEKRFIKPGRREAAIANMIGLVAIARRADVPAANGTTMRLEAKPIAGVTKADLEAFRDGRRAAIAASEATRIAEAETARAAITALEAEKKRVPAVLRRRAARKSPRPKAGEVTLNRVLARLQHLFGWAIDEGYLTDSPFRRNGRPVVKLNRTVEGPRRRRLDGDEERRLLDAAGPHLRDLIEAALETGCRRGELLSLQWNQVQLDDGAIVLPREKTKTDADRIVPITARLNAILEMRRTGPDGKDLPATAHVFGNEVGEPVKDIKTAWRLTCRRAGVADLHFHDLRRECGSRLLESPGVTIVDVRDWLGHTDVSTTNTYLATTVNKLRDVARKYEIGRLARTRLAHGGDQPAPAPEASHMPEAANRLH